MNDIRRMIMYGLVAPLVLALSLYGADQLSLMMSRGTVVELPRAEVGNGDVGSVGAACHCVACVSTGELTKIDGIGRTLAERIDVARAEGMVTSVDDIATVNGIGPKRMRVIVEHLNEQCSRIDTTGPS